MRQLILDVLACLPDNSSTPRYAIDLGCGDVTESALLLACGWHALAVDGEPAAIEHLLGKVPEGQRDHLTVQVAKFRDVHLPSAELVHAHASLPFCEPENFPAFWARIVEAVKPGGWFAGQFFGIRDSWADAPDMTFHSEEQVRALFGTFEIERFHELEEDGSAVSGPKHWHVFTVIARKK